MASGPAAQIATISRECVDAAFATLYRFGAKLTGLYVVAGCGAIGALLGNI